jgi:hypothetical protein
MEKKSKAVFWSAKWYFGVPSGILECQAVFWSVKRYFGVLSGILECQVVFWSAKWYFGVPSGILECQAVFWSAKWYFVTMRNIVRSWNHMMLMDLSCDSIVVSMRLFYSFVFLSQILM